jgi:hypothetical protein
LPLRRRLFVLHSLHELAALHNEDTSYFFDATATANTGIITGNLHNRGSGPLVDAGARWTVLEPIGVVVKPIGVVVEVEGVVVEPVGVVVEPEGVVL